MTDDTDFREQLLALIHRHDLEADDIDEVAADLERLAERRRSDREVFIG